MLQLVGLPDVQGDKKQEGFLLVPSIFTSRKPLKMNTLERQSAPFAPATRN
jgi:hypothetical protein